MENERLYKPEEVAKILNMQANTVRGWLRDGTIKGIKVGGKIWRVKESELNKLLQKNGQEGGC